MHRAKSPSRQTEGSKEVSQVEIDRNQNFLFLAAEDQR